MSSLDRPNSARHALLKAMWRSGQRWETLVDGTSTWVPVGGGGVREPTWDHNQEYRIASETGVAQAPDPRAIGRRQCREDQGEER